MAEETAAAAGGIGATEHSRDAEGLTGLTGLTGVTDNESVDLSVEQQDAEDISAQMRIPVAAEIEYAVPVQKPDEGLTGPCNGQSTADSAKRNSRTCAGYGQQTWDEKELAAKDAMIQYCIQLAAAEEEATVGGEVKQASEEQTVTTAKERNNTATKMEVEGWSDVLEAVEMSKKAELAEIEWTADAEVNKWMAAVETAVETTRNTIQKKVEKMEVRNFKDSVDIGMNTEVQVKNFKEGGQVA